jgi:hypothetical protein
MANKNYMEPNKIFLARWVDLVLKQTLTIKNIKFGFMAKNIWPLGPNAMNNKFQPSSLYTRPSNDGNGVDNTSVEQDDQG